MARLLDDSGCQPWLRRDVIVVPPHDAVYGWICDVPACECVRGADGLCTRHHAEWMAVRTSIGRPQFLAGATPIQKSIGVSTGICRICPERPAKVRTDGLCARHTTLWRRARERDAQADFVTWLSAQSAFPSHGECRVVPCWEPAETPLGLCPGHVHRYLEAGKPGHARLPQDWFRMGRNPASALPVVDDHSLYEQWLGGQNAMYRAGHITLKGCRPVVKLQLQWGLWAHAQLPDAADWPLSSIQQLADLCRTHQVASLFDLLDTPATDCPVRSSNSRVRMMVREITDGVRTAGHTQQATKAAGFIETEHFGRRFKNARSKYDLTAIGQVWLRDLVWDFFADQLRSVSCPRTRGPFDALRRAAVELSAFLEVSAADGGHDPTCLGAADAERFVADHRRRARDGLPALGVHRSDGRLSTITDVTRRFVFNHLRALFMRSLEAGRTEAIGLSSSFVTSFPPAGTDPKRSRKPFSDDTARALANQDNLERFSTQYDSRDRGLRDIWEGIVLTGRRCQEIMGLRLDCVGRYQGLPVLWHDQTKVGRYDQAIRIPERLAVRLEERRETTLGRFRERYGREPSAQERSQMALFPSHIRNPRFDKSIAYTTFNVAFRGWVGDLELGPAVPHQARHTMATRLLNAGASLAHIRQYMGQVSDRMAEHYTHITDNSMESVLSRVWVSGPGSASPGAVLSRPEGSMSREVASALSIDLGRLSTPTDGGFCTFQPVVDGSACPWRLNCEGCEHFVLSGADLVYWKRKQEQWRSIAERAPDDNTAEYLHEVFEPTAQAIAGLEQALDAVGLLDQALDLDLRRPQDYFHRVWSTAFPASELRDNHGGDPGEEAADVD